MTIHTAVNGLAVLTGRFLQNAGVTAMLRSDFAAIRLCDARDQLASFRQDPARNTSRCCRKDQQKHRLVTAQTGKRSRAESRNSVLGT